MTDANPTTEAGRALLKAYPDTTDGDVTRYILAVEAQARAAGAARLDVERVARGLHAWMHPRERFGGYGCPCREGADAILDAPAEEEPDECGHLDQRQPGICYREAGHTDAHAYERPVYDHD